MATRGSEWISLKRSLIILHRLRIGPASSGELIQAVSDALGAEAYPLADKARRAAFKHDRDNLRKNLEVDFHYDPRQAIYMLRNAGPFASLELAPDQMRTLAIMYHLIVQRGSEFLQLRHLLEAIIAYLPQDEQNKLMNSSTTIDIRLEQLFGPGLIKERIWNTVDRAIEESRKLVFNYQPANLASQGLWIVEVAPMHIQFRNGQWYLQAHELSKRSPDGSIEIDAGYQRYRLSFIQDDDTLKILPQQISGVRRRPPRHRVHYRLLPGFSDGAVRNYFDEMKITPLADGGFEISAVTDDLWEAARLLIAYGDECVVLGSDELRNIIHKMVGNMAKNYNLSP